METTTLSQREMFRQAVAEVAARAHAKLPACAGRIDSATKLVLAGDVVLLPEGGATVASRSDASVQYHTVNGQCTCKDFARAPEGLCAHRLAYGLARRAAELVPLEPPCEPFPDNDPGPVEAPVCDPGSRTPPRPEAPHGIDPRHIVVIRQKPFVRYAGLLQMAYAQGLTRLETTFISVTAEVALAQCTVTFADGRVVTDVADSTPGNVGATVKLHWPRLAATRAAARALRNALALDMCALEELADE